MTDQERKQKERLQKIVNGDIPEIDILISYEPERKGVKKEMQKKFMSYIDYKYRESERQRKAIKFLLQKNYSTEELIEMHKVFNSGGWDERAGEKPEGFDRMKRHEKQTFFTLLFQVEKRADTKHTICYPWVLALKAMIPDIELKKSMIKEKDEWLYGRKLSDEEAELEARAWVLSEKSNKK